MNLGFNQIIELCLPDLSSIKGEIEDWPSPGCVLKEDGIWIRPPSYYKAIDLTFDELSALTRHPTGDYSKPALDLPCALDELINFLKWDGSLECCGYYDEERGAWINPLMEIQSNPGKTEIIYKVQITQSRTHRLISRTTELSAEIETARSTATNSKDYHSVWAEILRMAKEKMGPFTGSVNTRGVEYRKSSGSTAWFNKDALRKRMLPSAR